MQKRRLHFRNLQRASLSFLAMNLSIYVCKESESRGKNHQKEMSETISGAYIGLVMFCVDDRQREDFLIHGNLHISTEVYCFSSGAKLSLTIGLTGTSSIVLKQCNCIIAKSLKLIFLENLALKNIKFMISNKKHYQACQ